VSLRRRLTFSFRVVPEAGREIMLDRSTLVVQMAKAFVGEGIMDPDVPAEDIQEGADEALSRVELYLGMDVEQAREILARVLDEVS
jgi:hypothetical protein